MNLKDTSRGASIQAGNVPGSGTAPSSPTRVGTPRPANGTTSQSTSEGVLGLSMSWETWFQAASPSQQAELLALARRQGLVYVQQMPTPSAPPSSSSGRIAHQANGNIPKNGEVHPNLLLLQEILGGQTRHLQPIEPAAVEVLDSALDFQQRQAVARALATPDICLIQGLPGSGKTRVVTEILTQAAQQGLRVLFLAQHASCLDGVLESLAERPNVCALRLTSPGEMVPPPVQPLLLAQAMRTFRSQALSKAQLARERAEEQCHRRRREEEIWSTFPTLIERHNHLQKRLQELRRQTENLPTEVEAAFAEISSQSTSAIAAYHALAQANVQEQATLQGMIEEVLRLSEADCREVERLQTELQELEPLYRAKKEGKWWAPGWWKATFHGQILTHKENLDQQLQKANASWAERQTRQKQLQEKSCQLDQTLQGERSRLIQEEVARQQKLLDQQVADLRNELHQLHDQWQTLGCRLELENLGPDCMTLQAVEAARKRWLEQKCQDEENCSFARQWTAFLEETGERLACQLPALAGIVAGTIASLNHETQSLPEIFDLLVLEEAEQFTEASFLPLARKARRWVLVGNFLGQSSAVNAPPANPRELRTTSPRPVVFQRLWETLHADPARLPYSWGWEGERLLCEFRTLSTSDRNHLESECLADAPDIELRILTLPRAVPVLAQVVFPPNTSLAQAKEFIYRELQDVPLRTPGRNGWLEEHADHYLWRLLPQSTADATPITLEAGLREWMVENQTSCLEFAKTQWTRDQVNQWLLRHFRWCDFGRTVFLQMAHRMAGELASWVGDVLFPGIILFPSEGTQKGSEEKKNNLAHCHQVSFVSVPRLNKSGGGKAEDRKKLPREGAALEIDLAGGRFNDRLPAEFQAGLPRHGFANYLEAQAVVRMLEKLAHEDPHGKFTVLAFYPGQIELVRRLLAHCQSLLAANIEVGLPGQFRHRDCDKVLVSLTRSNFHRTGTLAPEEADLALALTRARKQLILVGDPGTLIRWGQYSEPAEPSGSSGEKLWMRQLARYLQGQGSFQAAFHLCEGY